MIPSLTHCLSEVSQRPPDTTGYCYCSWMPTKTQCSGPTAETPYTLAIIHKDQVDNRQKFSSLMTRFYNTASVILYTGGKC